MPYNTEGQKKLRRAMGKVDSIVAQYQTYGESAVGWCQRINRIGCQGRKELDPHFIKCAGAGLNVPHTLTALQAGNQMQGTARKLGWVQVHDLGSRAGVVVLIYFTGCSGKGHVAIAEYVKAKNGRIVAYLHDNNGVNRITRSQQARIHCAFVPAR